MWVGGSVLFWDAIIAPLCRHSLHLCANMVAKSLSHQTLQGAKIQFRNIFLALYYACYYIDALL
jgi:hypothetical protein